MFSLFKKIIGRNKKESANLSNCDGILPGLPDDYQVIPFERVVGYREEYAGYTAAHFFKGEEKILSLGSVLFPNKIQTGIIGLGYE